MLYLAFIFHNHQPYYKNLLTNETELPWVRLHGVKDYLDMVQMLEPYPKIHQTFNLVPSLIEQLEDYFKGNVKDKFLEHSYRPAAKLSPQEKKFILDNFFSINRERVIAVHPRYYELYLKKQSGGEFSTADFLDLQAWFNLAWIDPSFRQAMPELRAIVHKARYLSEADKRAVLEAQLKILKGIIPGYKKSMASGQIEVTANPYYHPVLPLLYSSTIAREANIKATLPSVKFSYPQDAKAQIKDAVRFYRERFGRQPAGMWPSEEGVSEHIIPLFIQAGIKWIVTDESILFRSLKLKKRNTRLLYQPHLLRRKDGDLAIIFRDRNLSDMIGFLYHRWNHKDAVEDFMKHLENTAKAFKNQDILLTIAMDGENAWEFYANDGHDFLELLYERLTEAPFLRAVTVSEYLLMHPAQHRIPRLAAGSWIYSEFGKWIGSPQKNKAWEYIARARAELATLKTQGAKINWDLAWKQMYILEGSDWFWWYGDNQPEFDQLFRTHLANFYIIIGKEIPDYAHYPL